MDGVLVTLIENEEAAVEDLQKYVEIDEIENTNGKTVKIYFTIEYDCDCFLEVSEILDTYAEHGTKLER